MKRRQRSSRTPLKPGDARERILAAAQTLFAAAGFDATSTKAIGEKADVPAGLVFYYFATKDDLLNALIKERSALEFVKQAVFIEQAERRLPANGPLVPMYQGKTGGRRPATPHAVLTALGMQFLAALRERQEVVRILSRELHTHPRAAQQFRQLREQAAHIVATYLDRFIAPRVRRTFPTEAAARVFVSDLVLASAINEPLDAEAFVAGAVHVLLDGRVPTARHIR